ncbi:outer membrane beta-barrel protein [Sphingomicrobium arenosum]|uniref:outer membrane beta-barrel protein n=1 Tax=Sphingomicrobium arenosum TaxID=2233861 RepID=UPI00223F7C68|nr:outer membrane beta-barrel protein [Sphingomicrobium arenosum]
MKKIMFATAAAAAALAATPAAAQSSDTEVYVGASLGYHQIDEIDFNEIGLDATTDIDGITYGAFAGVTLPTEGNMVLGLEGNFNLGNNSIDSEYGFSGLIGTRVGGGKVYLRGGYQWVDLDTNDIFNDVADDLALTPAEREELIDLGDDALDGSDVGHGYLVGIGGDFGLGGGAFVRANLDTIEFDTIRLTTGVGFAF